MMTNMALSLQCCVPRIQAGGLERGAGEASGMERKRWGQEYGNGRGRLKMGKERLCEENDRCNRRPRMTDAEMKKKT